MILKESIQRVQSENDQAQWYTSVTDAALYIAIGGFIDEANCLLEGLWKHNLPHDRTTWLPDIAFEMLWDASKKRPASVPFAKADIDELELSHRDYLIGSPEMILLPEPFSQTPYWKGTMLAATKEGKLPNSENEKEALHWFQIYFENTTENHPYEICKALSLATELAARNSKDGIAIDLLKKWANKFGKYPYDNAVVLIGCNRHVASLLVKGAIAQDLGLTKKVCDNFVNEAISAIDKRMTEGSSLVYGKLTWYKLLKKLSKLAIRSDPEFFSEEQSKNDWLGREPAKPEAIKEAEKRFGIKLPKDYKDFLRQSNGFAATSCTTPELIPIEEVNFLKKAYEGSEEILDIIKSYPGKDYPNVEDDTIAAYVERAISISRISEEEVWLIPPIYKNKEWECWCFSASTPGEERFRNFRYYIEETTRRLDG